MNELLVSSLAAGRSKWDFKVFIMQLTPLAGINLAFTISDWVVISCHFINQSLGPRRDCAQSVLFILVWLENMSGESCHGDLGGQFNMMQI